jgi:twitching motility protein PilT
VINLQQLLKTVVKQNASDLHLVVGSPPALRIDGRIVRVKSKELTPEETQSLCYSVITDEQKARFEKKRELDFSFGIKNTARFRGNLMFQRGVVSGVFRRIPLEIPDLNDLGMPPILSDITGFPNGLVLVTGPTGSGKSTTIASMLDKINRERRGHIVTIEDPIEYIHEHKNCIVNQREVQMDTNSYTEGLRYVLRQDPDVCLIGELRDLTAIETALTIAETGHLVFGSLHTNSAISSITRIVNVFPSDQQDRIRTQLSLTLNAVVSQRLIPAREGTGVVSASEVLLLNSSVRNLIRENKLHQIYGMMQVGQNKSGMVTLNQSLMNLILKRKIEVKDAFDESPDVEELDSMLKKAGI